MADVKAELQTQVNKIADSFMNKKADEVVNSYTEDCRVFPPSAPAVQGREALQAFFGAMAKPLENMAKVENNIIDVISMQGDVATSVNNIIFYNTDGKIVDTNKSMTVWRKVDNNWLIHWTAWNGDKAMPQ